MKKLLHALSFVILLLMALSTAQAESAGTDMAFLTFESGAIFSGEPGYEFHVGLDRGSALPSYVDIELCLQKTGEVLMRESVSFLDWGSDRNVYCSFRVPEFESNAVYDLIVSDENGSVSASIILVDERSNSTHVEPDDFYFGFLYDYETDIITRIEDSPQINGVYQVPLPEDGFIEWHAFFSDDLNEVARFELQGVDANGKPAVLTWAAQKQGGSVPLFGYKLSPGIYGPYDLVVTCGDLKQEYKVQFIYENGQEKYETLPLFDAVPSFIELYSIESEQKYVRLYADGGSMLMRGARGEYSTPIWVTEIWNGQSLNNVLELDNLISVTHEDYEFAGWIVFDVAQLEQGHGYLQSDDVLSFEVEEEDQLCYYLRDFKMVAVCMDTAELSEIVCGENDLFIVALWK